MSEEKKQNETGKSQTNGALADDALDHVSGGQSLEAAGLEVVVAAATTEVRPGKGSTDLTGGTEKEESGLQVLLGDGSVKSVGG